MNFDLARKVQEHLHHAWLWVLHDNDLSFIDPKAHRDAVRILESLEKIVQRERWKDLGVRRGRRHTCPRCGKYVRP